MESVFDMYMTKCAEQFFESPALQAFEVVTKAVEEDNKRNYVEALRLYELALEHFRSARREARTDKVRKLLRTKYAMYSARAKEIRRYLQQQSKETKCLNRDGSCEGNNNNNNCDQHEDYLLSDSDDEFPKKKRWFLLCC